MPTLRDDAVCIRHWDWSETSQTVSLFTRTQGILRGLAKGAKREKGPFSGGLEILTRGEVLAIMKPGRGLATLTAWDLRETYPRCRTELLSHHAGLYTIDLIHHALPESDPHPPLFDTLAATLRALGEADSSADPAWEILRFQWALLTEIGHLPEVDRDSRTGGALERVGTLGFDPRTGGLTQDPGGGTSGVWRVRSETIELLRSLRGAPQPARQPETVLRAMKLLAAYLTEQLEREPSTQPFVLDLFGRHTASSALG